jgi:hypothetical protein
MRDSTVVTSETRCPRAGPDGLTFIAVGARPGLV